MIETLFQSPPDRLLDPRIRWWNDLLSQGTVHALLEVIWPPYVVGMTSPEMTIHVDEGGDAVDGASDLSWDDELNEVLVRNAVKAADPEQEALRFSLSFLASFRKAEQDYGAGFFNAVFFDVLKETGLAEEAAMQPLIRDLDTLPIIDRDDPEGRYRRCQAMIRSALQIQASDLTQRLGYPRPEAQSILIAALADYIDRRFSVSIRRQRGLL